MRCRGRKQFVPTQFTQMSLRASGAALGDHFVIYQADPELVNALVLGNSIILTGTLAARPAASIAGRLYFATDNGSLYRDSGSAWATYSAIGFLSGAGAIPFAANPATAGYLSLPIGVNKTVLRSDGTAPTWSTKVILTDPDISQGIIPPSDAIALFLRAFSDTQVSGIFFVQNAAGSKTWVKVTPDGLTTIAQLLVQPGSDLFSLVLRPFSDTQSSGILFTWRLRICRRAHLCRPFSAGAHHLRMPTTPSTFQSSPPASTR